MNSKKLIQEFSLTWAPSGYEKRMAERMKAELGQYCDSVSVDRVGNVIGLIKGTNAEAGKMMVFAHMDSIGLVVKSIEDNGFLRVERVGGIPEKVLPGLRVVIENTEGNLINGVVGMKSHHCTPAEEKYVVDKLTSLYVDIGAQNDEEVRAAGIDVGCFITYLPQCDFLLGNCVSATSLDNRGGCLAVVEIAEKVKAQRPECDTFFVGTVWEEFNLRGAMMAARNIKPDGAIALDVCISDDLPNNDCCSTNIRVSGGPTLTYYNFHGRGTLNGTISHPGLANLAAKSANECGITLQKYASTGMLTDASYLQLEDEGVAVIDMGFPARYTHSPIELCDLTDIEKLSEVVYKMLMNIDKDFSFNRYDI